MRIPEFNSLQFSSFENHVKREDNLKKTLCQMPTCYMQPAVS